MQASLKLYWQTFIHPWSDTTPETKISYNEVLGISWALHLIYTFYSIFAIYLGVKSYEYFSTSEDFTHLILNSFSFSLQKISLFMQLTTVVLYPLTFYFTYKFWVYLLRFYANLFNVDNNSEENNLEIVNAMYTSNLLLVLPMIGALLSFLAQIYFLFSGTVKRLNFSRTQAVLVLLTPFFLLFIFLILIVSYFIFLFSLL